MKREMNCFPKQYMVSLDGPPPVVPEEEEVDEEDDCNGW